VEVTETVFFERMGVMKTLIGELHEAGFTVAMDDFGSGFSSLNFLRAIPVDVIKIDRLFFEDFDVDERVHLLLEDILSIAKHLKLRTVAEGIEKKSQVDFLRKAGCDMIQGYYFHKPMVEREFDALVQADIEFR
jgi:EAL domain-containing protein (putative c-di-GMP-specific phosphodiesterase class I)